MTIIRTVLRNLAWTLLAWFVATLAFFASVASHGCAHVAPALEHVMQRADVQQLWACRDQRGPELARCIGIGVATQAVTIAAEFALEKLEQARDLGAAGGGAADHTEADRRRAAAELDEAMAILAREARAAGGAT